MENPVSKTKRPVDRRSFMKSGLLTGGAAAVGAGLLANGKTARAQNSGYLNRGDVAILRFLAAAELIESDLWVQYAELGGIGNNKPVEVDMNQSMNSYQVALSNLDTDGPQYIASNTLDEQSHAAFLNAYLESRGAEPVDFDEFRTLEGSTATGSSGIKRLTNLMHLNVDTSWYIRYRSTSNPDLEPLSRRRSSSRTSPPSQETTTTSTALPIPISWVTSTFRQSPTPPPFISDTSSKAVPVSTRP
jgi:hypothetical protein